MISRFFRESGWLYVSGAAVVLMGCSTTVRTGLVAYRTVTTASPSMPLGHYPPVGLQSKKAQIDAFVAYFTVKGFPQTDTRAEYFPSGRVKTFHYHAARWGSVVTVDIDVPHGKKSISTQENGGSTTTRTIPIYGTTVTHS